VVARAAAGSDQPVAVREVDCQGPGITRVGAGRGFWYRDVDGSRITDREVLDRIRVLAVPPAWSDVWICPEPDGHIQATGVDAKGRRQYRYHAAWQAERSIEKHDRVLRFVELLPDLRARVGVDLAREGMPKDRVLACAARLLELGHFRIGGESYAEENGSHGLATVRKDHARIRAGGVEFDYVAKGGQQRRVRVVDPGVTAVISTLKRRRARGDAELLAYRDDDGAWQDLRSEDINGYLHDVLGDDYSAKDFRTWSGTLLAAVALSEAEPAETEAEARRTIARVVEEVAEQLGNTPAVARSAYIDPRVVERYEADDMVEDPTAITEPEELEAEVADLVRRAL
jgi:DNA topoisomerase-1